MSLFPVKKLPRELKDIIYSYCQPDVQFARIDLYYPKLTLYRCIQDICEADPLYVRKLINTLSIYINKIEPTFVIHPPFHFIRLPDINTYNNPYIFNGAINNSYIYKSITCLLDKIYNRIYSSNCCGICRSTIYLYMRMIIHEIIKQHWVHKKRVRSMTL